MAEVTEPKEHAVVGTRLRAERLRQGIGLRELARRVSVSPSLVSQIERGKATPSVGTLYSIVNELGISLDELFLDEAPGGESDDLSAVTDGEPEILRQRVVRANNRQTLDLASGVRWERLTPGTEAKFDFLYVVYEVGGASTEEGTLVRHSGREYGYVLEGKLGVTLGFEDYELGPGDSITFDSTTPHRLWNGGEKPVTAIWAVVDHDSDPRVRNA